RGPLQRNEFASQRSARLLAFVVMGSIAPAGTRFTSEEYFALIDQGTLRPDDRVELLEGVIVAMAPENPRHAVATEKTAEALRGAVGGRAARYAETRLLARGERVELAQLPGATIAVDALLPGG